MVDDLINKFYYSIQIQLSTSQDLPTKLVEVARRCQCIWQSLKKANQNKFISEKMAKQQKTFKPTGNQQTFNLVQAAIPAASSNKSTTSAVVVLSSRPRLTDAEMTQLRTENRCFWYKKVGYHGPRCNRVWKLMPAIARSIWVNELAATSSQVNEVDIPTPEHVEENT